MARGTKLVIVISVLLALIVAVFAYLNREYISVRKVAQDKGVFILRAGGEEFTVSVEDIFALSPVDISANYKTTGRAAETRTYQGVSLKTLIESLGLDYSGFSSVHFFAADGYASALTMAEAMDSGNCYIAVSLNNKPLGTKESGGSGPFMMIRPNDRFSQRWCKFLLEVTLQ